MSEFLCGISSILLIALVCRVLLDVAVPSLAVKVFTAGRILLDVDLRICAGALVAPLLGRNRRHFCHGLILSREPIRSDGAIKSSDRSSNIFLIVLTNIRRVRVLAISICSALFAVECVAAVLPLMNRPAGG